MFSRRWEDVVLCESGDEVVIGWHASSGFNLRVDEESGRLVDAGPIPAAAVAPAEGAGGSLRAAPRWLTGLLYGA